MNEHFDVFFQNETLSEVLTRQQVVVVVDKIFMAAILLIYTPPVPSSSKGRKGNGNGSDDTPLADVGGEARVGGLLELLYFGFLFPSSGRAGEGRRTCPRRRTLRRVAQTRLASRDAAAAGRVFRRGRGVFEGPPLFRLVLVPLLPVAGAPRLCPIRGELAAKPVMARRLPCPDGHGGMPRVFVS